MATNSAGDYETLTGAIGADTARVRQINLLVLAYIALFVGLVLLVGVIALFGHSYAARPVVSVALEPVAKGNFPAAPWSRPVHPSAPPALPKAAGTEQPAAGPAITKRVYAGKALVGDPALTEQTPQGPLPRIAADGRTPLAAYAPPVVAAHGKKRIAIVMTGLGLSEKATADALKTLPPAITLAFSPEARDVQNWVDKARKAGHEVLLQVPMEPYDFASNDIGPHTLRAGSGEDANTSRLVWAMTRFTGYVGITNLLGARFLSDRDALGPVMTFLARRGLMFYDDGSAAGSQAAETARRADAAFAQGVFTIDTIQDPADIDRALSDLETRARNDGSAVATANLYPASVDRLTDWAKGLSARGFVLVPVSAIVGEQK